MTESVTQDVVRHINSCEHPLIAGAQYIVNGPIRYMYVWPTLHNSYNVRKRRRQRSKPGTIRLGIGIEKKELECNFKNARN